jgi:hypothetical protein
MSRAGSARASVPRRRDRCIGSQAQPAGLPHARRELALIHSTHRIFRKDICMAPAFSVDRVLRGNMSQAKKAMYLRGRSAFFHRLAKDYDEAGRHPVWKKLTEVAVDIDAQATDLERKRASRLI